MRQQLLDEFNDAIAGISASGSKPGLQDFFAPRQKSQLRVVGKCAFFLGVKAFRSALLSAAHRVNGGINVNPLNPFEPHFRDPSAIGHPPNLSAQPMIETFKLADLLFRDFFKEPPYRGLNWKFDPARNLTQGAIRPDATKLCYGVGSANHTDQC